MIAKLKGLLDSFRDDGAIIDVGGVGYLIFGSSRTLGQLGEPGDPVAVHVETHVREDHIHLYGFASESERRCFQLLQTVQGVGAKAALAILSALSPEDVMQAVAAQDKTMLTRADGVGPKLATRVVNELKDKVSGLSIGGALAAGKVPAGGTRPESVDGGPINFKQGVIRYIAAWPAFFFFGLGYLAIYLDSNGDAAHDKVSRSKVVLLPKSHRPFD